MTNWSSRSLQLDVRRPNHRSPLGGFLLDELGKIGGRTRYSRNANFRKSSAQLGVVADRVDSEVEFLNDIGRGGFRRTDAIPRAGVVGRQKLRNTWNVRQDIRATCCR